MTHMQRFLSLLALVALSSTSLAQERSPDPQPRKDGSNKTAAERRTDLPEPNRRPSATVIVTTDQPDEKPLTPVDKAMLRALEEEYREPKLPNDRSPVSPAGEPTGEVRVDSSSSPRPAPGSAPPFRDTPSIVEEEITIVEEAPEHSWPTLRLEALLWAATLDEDSSEVVSRSFEIGGSFNPASKSIADFEDRDSDFGGYLVRAELDLHEFVGLRALYFSLGFKAEQAISQTFIFDDRGFAPGQNVESEISLQALQFDFAFHAWRNSWFRFDVTIGARHMKTTLEYSTPGDPRGPARQRFELLTPMIGVDLAVQLFDCLEIGALAQVGALEYDAGRRRSRSSANFYEDDLRTLSVAVLEAYMRLDLGWFSLIAGARIEDLEQENDKGFDSYNSFEAMYGGLFAGLGLNF